jgi:hypothetical protein
MTNDTTPPISKAVHKGTIFMMKTAHAKQNIATSNNRNIFRATNSKSKNNKIKYKNKIK